MTAPSPLPPSLPFGSWPSPVTAARIVEGAASVAELRVDGDDIWWSENRPSEGGRTQLVRRTVDGQRHDVLPENWNARTQVHEYGGGAWTVRDGVAYFSRWTDQRLYRVDTATGASPPEPITPEASLPRALRYADADITLDRRWLVCVRESHEGGAEAVNEIVMVPADGSGDPVVVVTGPDFVASPRLSPDGSTLAWIQWTHPDMPWDSTELRQAAFSPEAVAAAGPVVGVRVAGGSAESIVQPEWTTHGALLAASDRTGWWNVHRFTAGGEVLPEPERLTAIDGEIGGPHWVFGQSWYAVLPDDTLVMSVTIDGIARLAFATAASDKVELLDTPYTAIGQLRSVAAATFAMVAAGPVDEVAPLRCRFAAEGAIETELLRPARDLEIDPELFSTPEPIEFDVAGRTAHALLYRPSNPAVTSPQEALPPLLVLSHGGPTSAARPMLDLSKQFWTSRGFAVVDVNYGGSTGYGRAYRDRLRGQWGVVDVEDCVAAALHLAAEGMVDPERLAIRGGSAGGYTTLCALAFHDAFAAGASHYGVADCEALARDTHKFESRYLDGLLGPYPEELDLYRARSPIHHVEGFDRPLIVFQGLEDEVVPPSQSKTIVDAVRAKGVPCAYLTFEGEQHGFRQAASIVRALEAELWFYGQVFGFGPADPIGAVPLA